MSELPYTVHSLFRGSAMAIADVRCRATTGSPGSEEVARGYDLVFPRSGFFVRHLGGRAFAADSNHVLLFTPDQPYRVSHPLPGGDECTVLSLSVGLVRDVAATVGPWALDRPPAAPVQAPIGPRADLVHRRLVHALGQGCLTPLAVEETALELARHAMAALARVAESPAPRRDPTAGRHRRIVTRAQEVLALRCMERLPLADLATVVGCSPYHLCRVFRREVGVPLHRYQRWLRLSRAVERIAGGERDLTALALDLGFSDHSHFTGAFRQELGFPPSALRRAETRQTLRELGKKLQAVPRRAV